MESNRKLLPALLFQIAVAGILCDCYLLWRMQGEISSFLLRFLLIFGPLVCAANRLYLRKSRSVTITAVLNVLFWLLTCGVCVFVGDIREPQLLVFAAATTGILTFLSVDLAQNALKLNTMVLTLDFNIVLLLLYVGLSTYRQITLTWLPLSLLGVVAALLGLISCRMKRKVGPRELVFLGIVILGLLLLMEILLATVAPTAGRGLLAAGNGILALLRGIAALFGMFLNFLMSLFPVSEEEILLPEEETAAEIINEMDYGNGAPLWFLALLIAVLLAAIVIFFLRYFRGRKTERKKTREIPEDLSPRRSLRESLLLLLARFRRFLSRRRFLRKHRNQPVGLYYLLEGSCRRSPLQRRAWETPKEFLTRLAEHFPDQPETAAALTGLINPVDAALFRQNPDNAPVPEASLLLRQVRRAARRSRLPQNPHTHESTTQAPPCSQNNPPGR